MKDHYKRLLLVNLRKRLLQLLELLPVTWTIQMLSVNFLQASRVMKNYQMQLQKKSW